MSMSIFRPIACRVLPSTGTGSNGSDPNTSKTAILFTRKSLPSFQMKEEKKPMLQENLEAASRREMMRLTAASMGIFSLVSPWKAEASPRNGTVRPVFLEDLMEKFGFSKSKDDEKKEEKSKYEDDGDIKSKAEEKGKTNLELKKETGEKKPKPEDKGMKVELKNEAEEKKPKPEDKDVKLELKNEADAKKPKEEDLKDKNTVVKNEAKAKKPKEVVSLKDKKPVAKK